MPASISKGRGKGKMLHINVFGPATIDQVIRPELARATIA